MASIHLSGIPPDTPSESLRALLARTLHSSPVNAFNQAGQPMNFQLYYSQAERQPSGGPNAGLASNRRRPHHLHNEHRWLWANIIIPDPLYAQLLLDEVETRPLKIERSTLRFRMDKYGRTPPPAIIERLLSTPFGGSQAVRRKETAMSLSRGVPITSVHFGTINREAKFVSEHAAYCVDKDKNDTRAYVCYDFRNQLRGILVKILYPEKQLRFRLAARTIDKIYWAPSFSKPRLHTSRMAETQAQNIDIGDGKADQAPRPMNRGEHQDVLIRLSQPVLIEYNERGTAERYRLHQLPHKPHISPYCLKHVWITGYNIVGALEQMATLYKLPNPWEQQLLTSEWRRFKSTALKQVEQLLQSMPIPLAFQYQRLLSNGALDPIELLEVHQLIEERFPDDGPGIRIRTLRRLACDDQLINIRVEDRMDENFHPINLRDRVGTATAYAHAPMPYMSIDDESFQEVASVDITPTAMHLDGPTWERSNRILRQYRTYREHFLRVSLVEEDLGSNSFLGNKSWEVLAFLKERYGRALKEGIIIAGRRFEFLAYSQSSLRDGTVWFMCSFKSNDTLITPQGIRDSLGNFEHVIRFPALYAARMSQAFSATHRGHKVDVQHIRKISDVKRNDKTFTDGAGRISRELADAVLQNIESNVTKHKNKASALQIRIAGCKGMVFVDPKLKGLKLQLRPSMVKFSGRSTEIEVAEAFVAPKGFNLNRPLIKILEDLGVLFESILLLQRQAEQAVYDGMRSITSASQWLDQAGFGSAFHAPGVFRLLSKHRLAFAMLPSGLAKFLQCALTYAAIKVLRNLKYKSRIRVPGCYTLVGGVDESNVLAPGEVFICIKPEKGNTETQYISGTVTVTRSPQMWPGDVRLLKAVGPPTSAFLKEQTNVIIFSRQGSRPEQDKMAGGDLDGDMYNVITQAQAALMPRRTVDPAAYPPAKRWQLDRPANVNDVADFVCEYMKNDYMGIVANRWLCISDTAILGSQDLRCQKLAQLYSVAVDFPKSGTPVEFFDIPMSESKKIPDFMSRGIEGEETYESPGFLGRLFRDIKLPYVKWTDDGSLPSFDKNPFDSFPSRDHPGRLSAYEQAVQRLPDPHRHLPDFNTYKHAMDDKISRMRHEYYRHMNFCAHTFRLDDADSLNEEEIWLTMVGTPGRSPNRHEQGMRLTLYISNFLNQIREELSMYDPDQLDDEEEGRCIIGQAFGLWMFTLRDMEENMFGSYSLNLLAFEHIHRSIERFEEQMKLKEEAREAMAMAQEQSEPRTLDNLACRPELAFTD